MPTPVVSTRAPEEAQQSESSPILHQFKVKLFVGLHTPVAGLNAMYHQAVLLLTLVNCFVINLTIDFYRTVPRKQTQLLLVMAFLDLTLLTVLVLELMLRLFVANCVPDYRGFYGMLKYLREYKVSRVYDSSCSAILLIFLCEQSLVHHSQTTRTTFRMLHLFLLFQYYRLFGKVFKNFSKVLRENIKLILMSLSIYVLLLIFISYSVYFLELYTNPKVNSLFESAWFGFVTLTTIGYGDIEVKLPITKVITAILSVCGFCVFTLPATIVGSALALRLRDKRQKILCLHPAASLLQKMWRFYALRRIHDYWPKYVLPGYHWSDQSKIKTLTRKQKYTLLFICKVSFLLAQNRFKYSNLMHSTGSVPLQYVHLQRKIELINNAMRKHKWDINSIHYQLKQVYADLNKCRSQLQSKRSRKGTGRKVSNGESHKRSQAE